MDHMLSRRSLLLNGARTLGAAALVSRFGVLSALAQTVQGNEPYKALVCIFLNGGNDGFNTVAPYEVDAYNSYYTARPRIALPRVGNGAMLQINSQTASGRFGLHPNLNNLLPLYNGGKMAVISSVGTLIRPFENKDEYRNNPTWRPRSLFDHGIQTDTWQELGAIEGWGNGIGRVLEQRANSPTPAIPLLVNVTGGASVYLTGTAPYITLPPGSQNGRLRLQGFTSSVSDQARLNALRELYRISQPDPVVQAISTKKDKAIDDGKTASDALASAVINTVFPATNLGNQLKQVAMLIKSREALGANKRQIFFASLGGFDTHEDQLANHPNLMRQLGDAMAAFYASTVELGVSSQVTTFTLSEFGRTVQNSDTGTDHAWGTNVFVLGDGVLGGRFYGQYPSLILGGADDIDTGAKARGRILPRVAVDQYAATLCKWFGLTTDEIRAVLPNIDRFAPSDLGFMA